ncbi:MAG: hypothetical protein K8M05_09490 [Deltaproteobacteria bacterium]|nr:hypothetical protein [Kofleriaceae bacterium]
MLRVLRQKWRLLKPTMDERARRLWAGTEADAIGYGGVCGGACDRSRDQHREKGARRGARGGEAR